MVNPQDMKHLKAYCQLEATGYWSAGFLPADLEIDNMWQVSLASKLAEAWLSHNKV